MKKGVLSILLLLVFLSGCSSRRMVLRSETKIPPAKLAILPINNLTNDVAGAQALREIIYNALKNNPKGYEIQNIEMTDEFLVEEGITDGGQLKLVHPIETSEILGTDGLLYIDLEELSLLTLPFYHVRKICLTYRLYNMGRIYKEIPLIVANRFLDINGILKTLDDPSEGLTAAAEGIAIHQGVRLLTASLGKHELQPEMGLISMKLLNTIPIGMAGNKEYKEQMEKDILYLKKKFETGEDIVPEETKKEYIESNFTEDGILIIN
jgi:hypothetical protein